MPQLTDLFFRNMHLPHKYEDIGECRQWSAGCSIQQTGDGQERHAARRRAPPMGLHQADRVPHR